MSDLIDRSKLFGGILSYNPEHEDYSDFREGWNACNEAWIKFIKEQPTAYDLDKVVERLETEGQRYICGDGYDAEYRLESIIKIVKRGEIDE